MMPFIPERPPHYGGYEEGYIHQEWQEILREVMLSVDYYN